MILDLKLDKMGPKRSLFKEIEIYTSLNKSEGSDR